MIDANEKTAEVFEVIADIAGGLAKRTGPLGIGALGVAAIADAVAGAIRSRGATVEEILAGIRTPRELNFPWDTATTNKSEET